MELFQIGFLTITIWDVIDVLIVSLVFYRVYRVMRGTIAAQIFVGLLVILFIAFLAQALNLRALGWLLRSLTDVWVVALIIIFQPELRRLLLLIGRNPILNRLIRIDLASTLGEIISGARELAARRHGALIVIIRTTEIGLFTEAGLQIHAILTKELLLSIFNPTSPLHDGAVIVKDRLVESARCTLPLSNVSRVDGSVIGTRHRAALGISEQGDVLALVVSEETGAISLAENGVLTRNMTLDDLRARLHAAFGVGGAAPRRGGVFGIRARRSA